MIYAWIFRVLLVYIAWTVAQSAFRESRSFRYTAVNAALVVLGLAAFQAFNAGTAPDPDCDPDPLYGGCSRYTVEEVTLEDRAETAGKVLLWIGIPTLLAGVVEYRRRP